MMLASMGFGLVATVLILCLCAFTAVAAEVRLWTRPVRLGIYVVTFALVIAWCAIVLYRFVTID